MDKTDVSMAECRRRAMIVLKEVDKAAVMKDLGLGKSEQVVLALLHKVMPRKYTVRQLARLCAPLTIQSVNGAVNSLSDKGFIEVTLGVPREYNITVESFKRMDAAFKERLSSHPEIPDMLNASPQTNMPHILGGAADIEHALDANVPSLLPGYARLKRKGKML